MRRRFSHPWLQLPRSRLSQTPRGHFHPHPSQRHFSTFPTPPTTQGLVPVGLNGSITITIHHPPRPSALSPIIIHLPRGPLPPPSPPPSLTHLALSANATVVSLAYRLSPSTPYPTPIHDVAAGYDWVVTHLVRGAAAHNGWESPRARSAPVAVCGELVGGGLAAMLTLTECRADKRGGVRALVVGAPIGDWTAMHALEGTGAEKVMPSEDEEPVLSDSAKPAQSKKPRKKSPSPSSSSWLTPTSPPLLSAATLLHARNTLFTKPEHYHDPFASPLLFFRGASSDIPPPETTLFNPIPAGPPLSPAAAVTAFLKPRRAYLRYPPLGSGLVLPRARVDVGRGSVLRDQGVELAEGMGRSWALYGGRGAWRGEGWGAESGGGETGVAENVEVREVEREGLWGEEELVEVGRWVAETLGSRA
ncbi:hypothetical protein MMC34_005106 [Xylographa carneopallida]|nr:hypothetical protein [Xylographa carneopallida]